MNMKTVYCFVLGLSFLTVSCTEPRQENASKEQGIAFESIQEFSQYDSLVIDKAERLRYVGQMADELVFQTDPGDFVITSLEGELVRELTLTGEAMDRVGKSVYQSAIHQDKLVILS